jgi:uncharacterized membrane protein
MGDSRARNLCNLTRAVMPMYKPFKAELGANGIEMARCLPGERPRKRCWRHVGKQCLLAICWFARQPTIAFLVVLLSGFFLLNYQLEAKSLWVDELFTAQVAAMSLTRVPAAVAADFHPPFYFLLIGLWARLSGGSEFALRWPSVFAAMIGLCLTYRLGICLGSRRMALLCAAILAFSPFFIEFSRMARYYSWTLALGTLATLLLIFAWRSDQIRLWVGYSLVSALLLYTFYLCILLLLAHGLAVVLYAAPRQRKRWLLSFALAVLCFLPWTGVALGQVSRSGIMGPADFAGRLSGLLLAFLYPFYAFSVGETIFPWFPTAVLATVAWLWLVGYGLFRFPNPWRNLLSFLVVVPILTTAGIVTYISTGTPFLNAPVRAFFVLPYFFILGTTGWDALSSLFWKSVFGVLIGLTWVVSLVNCYTGRQYLNPNYIIPAREVAQKIAVEAGPQDVVIGEWDSGFSYYFQQQKSAAIYLEASQADEVIRFLTHHAPERVWLVTIGRDRTREATPVKVINWLFANYRLIEEQGYVEQDPIYRRIKEWLLHRPAYEYKLLVRRFKRQP